jgi:hypothetical protein
MTEKVCSFKDFAIERFSWGTYRLTQNGNLIALGSIRNIRQALIACGVSEDEADLHTVCEMLRSH